MSIYRGTRQLGREKQLAWNTSMVCASQKTWLDWVQLFLEESGRTSSPPLIDHFEWKVPSPAISMQSHLVDRQLRGGAQG